MSKSNSQYVLAEHARRLAVDLSTAVDEGRSDALSDADLGRLFAAVVRLYGEKAQFDGAPMPFGGNITITATDVMIACSAMMEAVNVEVFELALWQNLTSIKLKSNRAEPEASVI